jgi:hypothetical protein
MEAVVQPTTVLEVAVVMVEEALVAGLTFLLMAAAAAAVVHTIGQEPPL